MFFLSSCKNSGNRIIFACVVTFSGQETSTFTVHTLTDNKTKKKLELGSPQLIGLKNFFAKRLSVCNITLPLK